MKYLPLYYEWLKTGIPKQNGMCDLIPWKDLNLFCPNEEEMDAMRRRGLCTTYWASETKVTDSNYDSGRRFNKLRQNIVLFLAAMNNEL